MMPVIDLPGLDRLLEVAHKHAIPLETLPPVQSPPRPGESLYGMPVDPSLAAAHARFGKIVIGQSGWEEWLMLPPRDGRNGLLVESEEWQSYFPHSFWPEHFRRLMPFGGEGLYRYAMVPELANPEGLQPVVHVDPYEEIFALPVASSVDRFFDTFSRYLEVLVEVYDYQTSRTPAAVFPQHVPELIAKDRPLMSMIKEGRFDPWMYERSKTGWRRESDIASTRAWIDKLMELA